MVLVCLGSALDARAAHGTITVTLTGIGSATAHSVEEQLLLESVEADLDEPAVMRIPLGNIILGELSTWNPLFLATGTMTVQIYSPEGLFPHYRVRARLVSEPVENPGDFIADDIGLGVIDIVGRNPKVAARFDYDPATVDKNVDGEPIFLGTVGNLTTRPNWTQIFHTRGFYVGSLNEFTLSMAVGPQFFTPTTDINTMIELEVRVQ